MNNDQSGKSGNKSAEEKFSATWDKVGDKAEELWKQFQAKTGFSDEKIEELKQKASEKIDELKGEMDTWDDEAKTTWEELKTKAGGWWTKLRDSFEPEKKGAAGKAGQGTEDAETGHA
jgi:DNA phosphorothioation-dependent restriction protein DptG